jgi:hypothetical protein
MSGTDDQKDATRLLLSSTVTPVVGDPPSAFHEQPPPYRDEPMLHQRSVSKLQLFPGFPRGRLETFHTAMVQYANVWTIVVTVLGARTGMVMLDKDHEAFFKLWWIEEFPVELEFFTTSKCVRPSLHSAKLSSEKIVVVIHLMVAEGQPFERALQIACDPELDWNDVRRVFAAVIENARVKVPTDRNGSVVGVNHATPPRKCPCLIS